MGLDEASSGPLSLIGAGANVAPDLDAIITRALASDPDDRFQTAEAMLDALEELDLATQLKLQRKRLSKLLTTTYESERDERISLVQKRLDQVRDGRVREQLPKLHGGGDSLPPEPTSVSLRPPNERTDEGIRSTRGAAVAKGALAASVVGVMLGGIVLFFQLGEQGNERNGAALDVSSSTAASTASSPARGTSTPAPAPVELTIDVTPSDATLVFDGTPLTGHTLEIAQPSTAEHRLVISAPGYKTVERMIVLERDTVLRVGLEAVADFPYPPMIERAPEKSSTQQQPTPPAPTVPPRTPYP